jgi:hypothetical protein
MLSHIFGGILIAGGLAWASFWWFGKQITDSDGGAFPETDYQFLALICMGLAVAIGGLVMIMR